MKLKRLTKLWNCSLKNINNMPKGIPKNPIEARKNMSNAKKGKMPKNFYDMQKLAIIKNTGRKQY